MNKRKKLNHKSIEVVWKRNSHHSRNSKLLPEMKEINLEDSVKKSLQIDSPSGAIKRNNINGHSIHKHVKRSLFQEDKNEESSKLSDVNKSKIIRRKSQKLCLKHCNLFRLMFPQTISNEEIEKQLTVNSSPSRSICDTLTQGQSFLHKKDTCHFKSPEIMSVRKRYIENNDLDRTNEADCSKLNTDKNNFNENNYDFEIDSKRKFNSSPKVSQIFSCSKSPIIMSTQKKPNLNRSLYELKQQLMQNVDDSKTWLWPQHSVCEPLFIESSTIQNRNRNRIIPQTSGFHHSKSPEITSIRKRPIEYDNLNTINVSVYDQFIGDNIKVNTNHCESRDCVTSPRKISDGLSKVSSILSCPRSLPTMSNQKKEIRDVDVSYCKPKQYTFQVARHSETVGLPPQCTVYDTPIVIKSPNTVQNQIITRTCDISYSKSPKIMSNKKRYTEYKNLCKANVLNHDKFIMPTNKPTYKNSCNDVINLKKRFNSFTETPPISPVSRFEQQMLSKQNKNMTEYYTGILNSKQHLSTAKNVRTPKLLPSHSGNATLIVKSPNSKENKIKLYTHHNKCHTKSPEIMSNRKYLLKNENLDRIDVPNYEKSSAETNKLNKSRYEPSNQMISSKQISDNLFEVSRAFSNPKFPQILSNRENIKINQETRFPLSRRRLFETVESAMIPEVLPSRFVYDSSSVVKPPNTEHDKYKVKPYTDHTISESKSSDIASNRKRCIEYDLGKGNLSNNDEANSNKLNFITKVSVDSNKKSESNVTNSSKVQSEFNSVNSEDIVESSEIIYPKLNKQKSKKIKVHCGKRSKIKKLVYGKQYNGSMSFVNGSLELNVRKKPLETNNIEMCDTINTESSDVINTENVLKSSVFSLNAKDVQKKLSNKPLQNKHPVVAELKLDDIQSPHSVIDSAVPSMISDPKNLAKDNVKDDLIAFDPFEAKRLEQNENKKSISFVTPSSEISVIPATPERDIVNAKEPVIENFTETILNSYVPLIEVDQSPKTPSGKNSRQALIQSVQSPLNQDGETLLGLFESVASPAQHSSNTQCDAGLPFKVRLANK